MKKSSILVGALALGTITLGTAPTFASLRTANGVAIAEAHCGDKKADSTKSKEAKGGDNKTKAKSKAKEAKCGEGKCGEGKCGGSSSKKDTKKTGK